MKVTPLGPGGEDITWPEQVAPRSRLVSSTRKIKPQTSNRAAGAAGGAGLCGGGDEGVPAACGTICGCHMASVAMVARAGEGCRCVRGTRDGVVRSIAPPGVAGL